MDQNHGRPEEAHHPTQVIQTKMIMLKSEDQVWEW